ncbi:MAG: Asp-tRNA(Asn)/Glu-tRNA(Gln) amidotransferase subunit GatA [Bacilli bacterium]
MSKYLDLSLTKLHELLKTKQVTPLMLVEEAFSRIEASKELNAFITLDKDKALEVASSLESMEVDNLLFGIPIAIKDNIVTSNLRTTCASKMLENFIPIYDATVIKKLKDRHMIIIGKTNMDEFAMGSTTESSYFKPTLNPYDKTRVPGGSSGGSAAAVGANLVPFALGSDTGGSIRQPAAYCGLVGMKPTYGRVSRYGLVAFASSLDQIGPMSRNVYENAVLLNALAGRDTKDLTSSSLEVEDYTRLIGTDVSHLKVAIPKYFMSDIVSSEVKEQINKVIDILKNEGIVVDYIDLLHLNKAVTLYQIIASGEASSNLARFDGIRYGYSTLNPTDLDELYTSTRSSGFGPEVKRRIMVGSYILSGDNATTYYNKALAIRSEMTSSFKEAFKNYDLIIGPTTTTTAGHLNEGITDPLKAFLDDVLAIPVNMAGLPGMNIPIGFNQDHLPVGMQLIANSYEEAKIYQLASFLEKKLNIITPGGE